ncbi:MAG TPA: DUF5689 domain-containing protein, partial [Flavitalea sp.]|nr:DUF5689 domain-containing protein [Flavitalea sp.]
MKKIVSFIVLLSSLFLFWGCDKDGNYPGATVSPYIAMFDLRGIYKGEDVSLTKDNMFGANKIAGLVVSDHTGGNIPAGLLVVQDKRRLGQLRGISIALGADAANYVPGDSVVINVEGGVLKKIDGILQLTGITTANITKVASGRPLLPVEVKSNLIVASPSTYESIFISVVKAGFDPSYPLGSTYLGDKTINDGFADMTLHTEPTASWANKPLPFLSVFNGIIFNGTDGKPKLWPRKESDISILSATAPKIAPILITGYLVDPNGTDANFEYIQLIATKNIDFAVTPFSVVTNNNAGASVAPASGWATGALRTYKFDLTTGTVTAGQYFYIGANKNIWGAGSTDISSSKWFGKMYATVDGDGF